MPELHYFYHDGMQTAHVEHHFTDGQIRSYVVTLSNGLQAFIKHMKHTGRWAQEPFTEHEIWPADLIEALGNALKLNFA